MDDTILRLARVLGATSIEGAGHDARFAVDDLSGTRLRVSIEGSTQRFMAVLIDGKGITRCTLDMAPVTEAFEAPAYPGRVTIRVGQQLIHLDSQPSVGLELESIDPQHRAESQRMRALASR